MDILVLLGIILLVLAIAGAFPRWPYSTGWGYGPSYVLVVVLVIVLVLFLVGRIHVPIR